MIHPGGSDPALGQARTERPARPVGVDIVAALLVFGGLFGATQLAFGDFVITGQLPTKGPILGVAAILYAASVALGVAIRTGRAWLPALNLAGLFAIVYIAAFGQPVALLLGLAHSAAAVLLFRTRSWFASMARWRRPPLASTPVMRAKSGTRGSAVAGQLTARSSRRDGKSRPSGKR